jgi:hypothetical protein
MTILYTTSTAHISAATVTSQFRTDSAIVDASAESHASAYDLLVAWCSRRERYLLPDSRLQWKISRNLLLVINDSESALTVLT